MPRMHDGAPYAPHVPLTFWHGRLDGLGPADRQAQKPRPRTVGSTGDVHEEVRQYFQARVDRPLSRESGRRMTENLLRFLRALRECHEQLDVSTSGVVDSDPSDGTEA